LLVAGPPYVLGGQANVRYLTGLQSSNAAVLVEPDASATLFTDFRYASRAREIEGVGFVETARNLLPAIGELLSGRRISFEEAHLPYAGYRALVDAGVDAVPSSGLVESLRAVKDVEEIASMRRAAALSDEIFAALAQERFSGRSERDLAWWVERSFREAGAEGLSFPSVVAAGATGSSPPRSGETSGPSPADTTTTPRDPRPYPRERIAGRQPSKRRRRARTSPLAGGSGRSGSRPWSGRSRP